MGQPSAILALIQIAANQQQFRSSEAHQQAERARSERQAQAESARSQQAEQRGQGEVIDILA